MIKFQTKVINDIPQKDIGHCLDLAFIIVIVIITWGIAKILSSSSTTRVVLEKALPGQATAFPSERRCCNREQRSALKAIWCKQKILQFRPWGE